METKMLKNTGFKSLGGGVTLAGAFVIAFTMGAQAATPTVITLTQTPCQFVEAEHGTDHGYKSTKKADCEAINAKSGRERLAKSKVMNLKAGEYIFRVTNKNVPYSLGFWIRGASLVDRALLPSTSGGGLTTGKTKDYKITLKPGKYVYSCPLNPTVDHKVVVE
jgi:hypothetical protein